MCDFIQLSESDNVGDGDKQREHRSAASAL